MAFFPLQAQNFSLSGAGCSAGDTILNLKSFQDINGTNITMSDLGSIAYLTIEPGNGTQEEQVSFTGVTQNTDGSAQLTGIKNVLFKTPYTESSGFSKTHPGSVVAILTNTAGFYNKFGILSDDSAITGSWTAPDPTALQGIATKNYVLNTATSGGSLTVNSVIAAGTAGETVSAGQILYLKVADGRWYKADASDTTTLFSVQLAISQGAGTAGNAISGGVLLSGLDSNQSALAAGTIYYVGTAGAISSSAGTYGRIIGNGRTSTSLYFNANEYWYTQVANTATSGAIIKASSTTGKLDSSFLTAKFGGDGSDGILSSTSGTGITLTLASGATVVKNYTSISITGTGKLAFVGPNSNGTTVILKSIGDVTLTSSSTPMIDCSGLGPADGNDGYGITVIKTVAGQSTPGAGTGGTAGTVPTLSAAHIVASELSGKYPYIIPGAAGGGGGSQRGGGGGGGSSISAGSDGAGGVNASTDGNGAGGRGGGALIIECGGTLTYTTASGISVKGNPGGAGSGSNSGGGGGGAGGMTYIFYNTLGSATGTIIVDGGIGGARQGNGGVGGAGGNGYSLVAKNTEFY